MAVRARRNASYFPPATTYRDAVDRAVQEPGPPLTYRRFAGRRGRREFATSDATNGDRPVHRSESPACMHRSAGRSTRGRYRAAKHEERRRRGAGRGPHHGHGVEDRGRGGDTVEEGDTVVILESMKMEMPVEAEDEGTVRAILVEEGQSVSEGDALVELE